MSRSSLHPPKTTYLLPLSEEGHAGVTYYCPTCHHWLFKWFEQEYTPKIGEVSDGWHGKCRLSNTRNPLRCNDRHVIVPEGPAPQSLRDWFEADQPDWPKCPEDFMGEERQ
jgi:hypothetical protein